MLEQRDLCSAITMVKENRWVDKGAYVSDESHGKTLGIIGIESIGKKVAKIATALGMKVVYEVLKKRSPLPFFRFPHSFRFFRQYKPTPSFDTADRKSDKRFGILKMK